MLASYRFAAAGSGLIHDVVVTRRAAYFSDSLQPVLYTANARFATPPSPETAYQVVRLPAR